MLMVPLSAHALFARPLVVAPESVISVDVLQRSNENGVLWCDGRRTVDLPFGARIEVTRSDSPVKLARLALTHFRTTGPKVHLLKVGVARCETTELRLMRRRARRDQDTGISLADSQGVTCGTSPCGTTPRYGPTAYDTNSDVPRPMKVIIDVSKPPVEDE